MLYAAPVYVHVYVYAYMVGCACVWGLTVCDLMFTIAKDAAEEGHRFESAAEALGMVNESKATRQQQVISINLMVFHLQPKLNRLFAVKNFELRWEGKNTHKTNWFAGSEMLLKAGERERERERDRERGRES